MSLSQLGVGVAALVIVVFALLTNGMNTLEMPAPADDADRSIDAGATELDADDAPPEDSDLGAEQKPAVADDDGADDSGDDSTTNENGNGSGTLETVETGDDDTDSPVGTARPRGSPVGVSDYNDGDNDDGSPDDSFSGDSTDDFSTDDSIDDASSGDSANDAGDNAGDDSGGGSSGGDSGDDVGMCMV